MLQEKQYHFFISLNPNTSIFNSPQKNLLNSFYGRTFVWKYHLYYISTDMENTTHKEETHKTPFARMQQRLKERKRRIMRLIELKRLRRIRKKTVPGTPIARIAVPSWRVCIAIAADNMPSTSTSPSGNTSDNTLKMSISLIAKSGKPCGWCLPVPDSWPTNSMPEKSIPTYILSGFICVSLLFSLPFSLW